MRRGPLLGRLQSVVSGRRGAGRAGRRLRPGHAPAKEGSSKKGRSRRRSATKIHRGSSRRALNPEIRLREHPLLGRRTRSERLLLGREERDVSARRSIALRASSRSEPPVPRHDRRGEGSRGSRIRRRVGSRYWGSPLPRASSHLPARRSAAAGNESRPPAPRTRACARDAPKGHPVRGRGGTK